MMKKGLLAGLVLIASNSAWADWQVDNDFSKVSFASVKKQSIGEAHHFKQISGKLTEQGKLSVAIELASVDTMIPIRNERMQKLLFETKFFPQADIVASVDPAHFNLPVGTSKIVKIQADVGLHGVNKLVDVEVMITKVTAKKLLVNSLKPIIIRPVDFGLDKGVMKLQAVAKLPSITQAVPVNFVLTLNN
jgi:hypothetical protein